MEDLNEKSRMEYIYSVFKKKKRYVSERLNSDDMKSLEDYNQFVGVWNGKSNSSLCMKLRSILYPHLLHTESSEFETSLNRSRKLNGARYDFQVKKMSVINQKKASLETVEKGKEVSLINLVKGSKIELRNRYIPKRPWGKVDPFLDDTKSNYLYENLFRIWREIFRKNESWPFRTPVDIQVVTDYLDYVKKPIDLSAMHEKLKKKEYRTKGEFREDLKLMFQNCRTYNTDPDNIYVFLANYLEDYSLKLLEDVNVNEALSLSKMVDFKETTSQPDQKDVLNSLNKSLFVPPPPPLAHHSLPEPKAPGIQPKPIASTSASRTSTPSKSKNKGRKNFSEQPGVFVDSDELGYFYCNSYPDKSVNSGRENEKEEEEEDGWIFKKENNDVLVTIPGLPLVEELTKEYESIGEYYDDGALDITKIFPPSDTSKRSRNEEIPPPPPPATTIIIDDEEPPSKKENEQESQVEETTEKKLKDDDDEEEEEEEEEDEDCFRVSRLKGSKGMVRNVEQLFKVRQKRQQVEKLILDNKIKREKKKKKKKGGIVNPFREAFRDPAKEGNSGNYVPPQIFYSSREKIEVPKLISKEEENEGTKNMKIHHEQTSYSIKRCSIALFLAHQGFEEIEEKALDVLVEVIDRYIQKMGSNLNHNVSMNYRQLPLLSNVLKSLPIRDLSSLMKSEIDRVREVKEDLDFVEERLDTILKKRKRVEEKGEEKKKGTDAKNNNNSTEEKGQEEGDEVQEPPKKKRKLD